MVNSGTGHDRCPSVFPGPMRRPGATAKWRLRNYKNCFWFQEGAKIFCLDLDRSAWALRQRRQGALTTPPFAVSYLRARRTAKPSLCFCFSSVLGLRALFQCGPLGRDGLVEKTQRDLTGLQLSRHEAPLVTLRAGPVGSR
jgi:hypothetical protein